MEGFSPHFKIAELDPEPSLMDIIYIKQHDVEAMMSLAKFSVPQPRIHISNTTARTTINLILKPDVIGVPTSGFPRQLGYEDEISRMSASFHLVPTDLTDSSCIEARQKIEREAALRRAQSQHIPQPWDTLSRTNGSVRSSPSRMSSIRLSGYRAHTRATSAPSSGGVNQAEREYAESPDMMAEWVKRLPEVWMPELDDTTVERLASTTI